MNITNILICKLISLLEWKFCGYSCGNEYTDYIIDRPYEILMEINEELSTYEKC